MKTFAHILFVVILLLSANIINGQGNEVIRVLFMYTPAVETAATAEGKSILNEVDLSIAAFNQTCQNSQSAAVAVQAVAVVRTPVYVEQCFGLSTDLSRFQGTIDGFMDEVHSIRDQYCADACFLMVSCTDDIAAGLANMHANLNTAFGVGYWQWLHTYRIFAHELGHNLGLQHDRPNGTNGYFSDGHGYVAPNNAWYTVMAYPPAGVNPPPPHIRHWSNPDVVYSDAQATGTVLFENNARVLRGRSNGTLDPASAGQPGFWKQTPTAMTLQNQTIASGTAGTLHSATAIATNTITIGDGFTVSNGGRFSAMVDPAAFGKRQTPPRAVSTTQKIEYGVRAAYSKVGSLHFSCGLPEPQVVNVRILSVSGQTVFSGTLGMVNAGNSRHKLSIDWLAPNLYYIEYQAGAWKDRQPLIVRF